MPPSQITDIVSTGEPALSSQQMFAYTAIEQTSDNIFITGKAGTGKSVLLMYFIQNTSKNVAVVAPTGIAAINVGGQTIHSFFGLDIGVQKPQDPEKIYNFSDESAAVWQKLDTLVIDEISMVRADVMQMINAKLQAARNSFYEPFGGCQLVVFGDLFQLPPVEEKDLDAQVYLREHYQGIYFFDAPIIKAYPLKVIELQHIFRQSDPLFIELLNKIRTGSTDTGSLGIINRRYCSDALQNTLITLTCTNKRAEAINTERLALLEGKQYVYEGLTEGYIDPKDTIAEQVLHLKVGAHIMMLRNDPQHRWVNGTLGTVAELTPCSIAVEINGNRYIIGREKWEARRYRYLQSKSSLDQEVVGVFTQFPLKLAYALTIHKSQGQTLDGVIVDLGKVSFAPGQTYVALSRCRSLDKLYVDAPIRSSDISVDKNVLSYMEMADRYTTDQYLIATAPQAD